MHYNPRAIMAMIASALNSTDDAYFEDGLAKIEATPDRNALLCHMVDGRTFQIAVTEVV